MQPWISFFLIGQNMKLGRIDWYKKQDDTKRLNHANKYKNKI